MNSRANLILASNSPRRHELLRQLGFPFMVRVKPVNEDFPDHLRRGEVVEYLASHKAEAYRPDLVLNDLLITADTIVCVDDSILNKPAAYEEACQMLRVLSGRQHEVITGVSLLSVQKQVTFHDTTTVHFKELSEAEIEYYVRAFSPYDKAGGYGIQEWIGMVGITSINGSYFNVMGLPVQPLYEALNEF